MPHTSEVLDQNVKPKPAGSTESSAVDQRKCKNNSKIKEWYQRSRASNPCSWVFAGIKNRCENPKHDGYMTYGGSGIKCLISLEEVKFLWNRDGAEKMINPSIDRLDPFKSYEVGNCRFIELINNKKRGIRRSDGKIIQQIDAITGKVLNSFISGSAAGRYIGIDRSQINRVISGEIKSTCGFIFKAVDKSEGYTLLGVDY